MVRIGLDARATEHGFKAHSTRGTGRYARELTAELQKINNSKQSSLLEFVPISGQKIDSTKFERAFIDLLPFGKVTAETQLFLPKKLDRLGLDLIHFFSHGDATSRLKTPYVVSVLDLIPLRFPELYRGERADWRFHLARTLELRAIRQATGVLAISQATKRDLIELLHIPEERIIVTPLGVSSRFTPRNLEQATWQLEMCSKRAYFQLPPHRPVILYVGGIDARKNLAFMLEVHAEVVKHAPPGRTPLLVLVGPYEQDEAYTKLLATMKSLQLEDSVKLYGYLDDEMLVRMYQAATVTVFPSLYEGFGLPALESLACGTPVIAGNNSSLPEVVGTSGILLEDNNKELWAKGILELITSEEQQYLLSVNGVTQAARFTWEKTARKTCEAYLYFAQGKRPSHQVLQLHPGERSPTNQARDSRKSAARAN